VAEAPLHGLLDVAVCVFGVAAWPPLQGFYEEGDPAAQITKEVVIKSGFVVVSNVTKT
jgi:hypothetical protein